MVHEEIGDMEAEKVRLWQAVPTDPVGGHALRLGRLSGTQLETMASVPQSHVTLAQIKACRVRTRPAARATSASLADPHSGAR